uniref:(northern house mosquito) hypothetical protein n=1 Tax=Culex pipiens TaxID=7175 RepID=A0A8D8CNC0_CULPI
MCRCSWRGRSIRGHRLMRSAKRSTDQFRSSSCGTPLSDWSAPTRTRSSTHCRTPTTKSWASVSSKSTERWPKDSPGTPKSIRRSPSLSTTCWTRSGIRTSRSTCTGSR